MKILVTAVLTVIIIFLIQNIIIINNSILFILFYGILTVCIYLVLMLFMKVEFFKVKL
jgi:hypothetical protein